MTKSTLLHLRFPFSFFLLPVFLFAVAVSGFTDWFQVCLIFIILHLLIYPASNGYNSYFDKDEYSIGGLKTPPKITSDLYWVSLVLDGMGIVLGLWFSWQFSIMVLIYGLISKAYSHPSVRLKSKPILGWLAVGIFQGYFVFLSTIVGLHGFSLELLSSWSVQFPAVLSSALLLGSYPMTQIYQHKEDRERGDMTLSLKLGIMGTFHFTAVFFFLSNVGFVYYFFEENDAVVALIFQMALVPVVTYFGIWYFLAKGDKDYVSHERTMRLNFISGLMLNAFFLLLIFY